MKTMKTLSLIVSIAITLLFTNPAESSGPFIDNDDGTVFDESTGLTWLESDSNAKTFAESCEYCRDLITGGYDDWRVPSVQEAITILDYPDGTDPIFTRRGSNHWTNYNRKWDYTWLYNDHGPIGMTITKDYIDTLTVRCVRGRYVSRPSEYLTSNGEIVEDERNNLIWTIIDDKTTRTYWEAKDYCSNLVYAGRADWRLPTPNELVSITDYTTYDEWGPMVDGAFAIERGRKHYNYWTSSVSYAKGYYWRISFRNGGMGINTPINRSYVLCACENDSSSPPIADAGEDVSISTDNQSDTVLYGTAADIDNDLLVYRWLDGDRELSAWKEVGGSGEAYLDLSEVSSLCIGEHVFTLEVSDGQATATDEVALTVSASDSIRYEAYCDGTVADNVTGLMWQKTDDGIKRVWDDACQYCEHLELAGYDDWRAPELDELSDLVAYGNRLDPAFDGRPDSYWSGTGGFRHGTRAAWAVRFAPGYEGARKGTVIDAIAYVRCARGASVSSLDPSDHLQNINNKLVEDTHTGLIWQNRDDGNKRPWADAKYYCDELVWAGRKDWRLPTALELSTIIDYGEYDPTISTEVFDSRASSYWSSTASTIIPDGAWFVNFLNGVVNAYTKDELNYALCVCGGSDSQTDDSLPQNTDDENTDHVSGVVNGDYIRFGGRDWIMLDNTTGYVILKSYEIVSDPGCLPDSAVFDSGNDQTWEYGGEVASLNEYLNTIFYEDLVEDKKLVDENGEWFIEAGVNDPAYTWTGNVALLTETEFNHFRDNGPNLIGTSVKAIDFPGADPNINGNWWLLTPGVGYSETVPGSVVRFVADSNNLAAGDAENCRTTRLLRPTLHLQSGLYVAGGDGTEENPKGITDSPPKDSSPIAATLDIDPDTLNLKSNGNPITAYIELGEDADISEIDTVTIELRLNGAAIAYVEPHPTGIGDEDGDGIEDLMVKFDRQIVKETLTPGSITLEVFGYLIDDTRSFTGTDTITVIQPNDNESKTGGSSRDSDAPPKSHSGGSSGSSGTRSQPSKPPTPLPPASAPETEATPEAFVTRFYQQILGREPDSPGLAGWKNSLKDESNTGADVAKGFISSDEFMNQNKTNEAFLTTLYRAFFNREPDPGGYTGWLNLLNGAKTGDRKARENVLNGFLKSQEFEALCDRLGIKPY